MVARTMSITVRIGIVLFVLGVVGFFYIADKLFVEPSGPWYSTMIASLIMAAVGLALLWKEWGLKSMKSMKSSKSRKRGR